VNSKLPPPPRAHTPRTPCPPLSDVISFPVSGPPGSLLLLLVPAPGHGHRVAIALPVAIALALGVVGVGRCWRWALLALVICYPCPISSGLLKYGKGEHCLPNWLPPPPPPPPPLPPRLRALTGSWLTGGLLLLPLLSLHAARRGLSNSRGLMRRRLSA
jgi:hypothetical protein